MVNYSINIVAIIGIAYMFYGFLYGIVMLVIMFRHQKDKPDTFEPFLYLAGAIVVTALIFITGLILFFNAWRFEPLLQISQLFLAIVIFYLSIKDVLHNLE